MNQETGGTVPVPAGTDASPERFERLLAVMREIQTDVEADAMSLDGAPFSGRFVGERFGEVYATLGALARGIEIVATAQLATGTVASQEVGVS